MLFFFRIETTDGADVVVAVIKSKRHQEELTRSRLQYIYIYIPYCIWFWYAIDSFLFLYVYIHVDSFDMLIELGFDFFGGGGVRIYI